MKLKATILKADLEPSGYFSLVFDVAGRPAFSGFYLAKGGATIREIEQGQRALSALCHAAGVHQITDSSQLIGLSLPVNVKEVEGKSCGSLLIVTEW